jgi:hypothetical protein
MRGQTLLRVFGVQPSLAQFISTCGLGWPTSLQQTEIAAGSITQQSSKLQAAGHGTSNSIGETGLPLMVAVEHTGHVPAHKLPTMSVHQRTHRRAATSPHQTRTICFSAPIGAANANLQEQQGNLRPQQTQQQVDSVSDPLPPRYASLLSQTMLDISQLGVQGAPAPSSQAATQEATEWLLRRELEPDEVSERVM